MIISDFNKKGEFSLEYFNDLVVRTQQQIVKDNNLSNYGFICIRVLPNTGFNEYIGMLITYELWVNNVPIRNLDTFISRDHDYIHIG